MGLGGILIGEVGGTVSGALVGFGVAAAFGPPHPVGAVITIEVVGAMAGGLIGGLVGGIAGGILLPF